MGQIIDFEKYKEERATKRANASVARQKQEIEMPTAAEIVGLNLLTGAGITKDNGTTDCHYWNGDTWCGLFEQLLIPYAKENNLDIWDVFAVFVMKVYGAEFLMDDDGTFIGIQFKK